MRFGKTKISKKDFYGAKRTVKIWDVNVDNIVISKLCETKKNSNYFIGHLDEVIRPLVLILPKMTGYIETSKGKSGVKNKNNKLMSLLIDDYKLLEKYKNIWIKIEDLQNIELDALPVYDGRYIKTKIRTCSDTVYTKLHSINVPEYGAECKSFTIICIDLLLVYDNGYYLQVYLDNYASEIIDKQMVNYLDENLLETDHKWAL